MTRRARPIISLPFAALALLGAPHCLALAQEPRPARNQTDAVADSVRMLSNSDAGVRRRGATALVLMGSDAATAAPALAKLLGDPDPTVGDTAEVALAVIGPGAVPALVDRLRDPDAAVRRRAASALRAMGAGAAPAVQALSERLGDAKAGVRRTAVAALGAVRKEAAPAVPAIVRLLKNPDPADRAAAARALGRIGVPDESVVSGLIGSLRDDSPGVRVAAADALGRLGPAAGAAVEPLAALVQQSDPSVRRAAADALTAIGATGVHELEGLLDHADPETRHCALDALARMRADDPAKAAALAAALYARHVDVRVRAAAGLGAMIGSGDAVAGPLRRAWRSDPDRAVRKAAGDALVRSRGRGVLDPFAPVWRGQLNKKQVVALAFSPGGEFLGSASEDGVLAVCDADDGRLLREIRRNGVGPFFPGQPFAFSPDGKSIAVAGAGATVYDVSSGRELARIPGVISCLAFAPDGRRLATDKDGAKVWDTAAVDASLRPARIPVSLEDWDDSAKFLAFSPDGKRVVAAGKDGEFAVWDAVSGKRSPHDWQRLSLPVLSPDGRFLASGRGHRFRLTEVSTGRTIRENLSDHPLLSAAAFSPGGKYVVLAGWGIACCRATLTGEEVFQLPFALTRSDFEGFGDNDGRGVAVAVSADGTRFAVGDKSGRVMVFDLTELVRRRPV